ncbi:HAD family hydrolase [Lichenicola sp.]|uniref:HAD family hydrolase n=1 Tax=Lichenicola sp. TaxID=2804529 RepID=UPI003AFFE8D1
MSHISHSPRPSVPLLVFDLDGTLVDSVPDLLACANRMLRHRALDDLTADDLRPMVGDGIPTLVQRVLAHRGAVADDQAIEAYTADYTAHAADASQLFEGIAPMLQVAVDTGWRLAVCTNKPVLAARALLAALGIEGLFAAIGGGDSFPARKPDPAHLLGTISLANGMPGRSVMVGDHRNDVASGVGAGVPVIFATWGYGPEEMGQGAGATLSDPTLIPALARWLLSRSST